MLIDMEYWSKVGKRLIFLIASVIGVFLAFKLAIFYMPFLVAFIISLIIEPLIRKTMKKTKLSRKKSSIAVLVIVISIILGLLIWGIGNVVSEGANLLSGLNDYIEKIYNFVQNIIKNIDFEKLNISQDIIGKVQDVVIDSIATISKWIQNGLTKILGIVTSLPTIGIYVVITILSLYFICTDKVYMLDQFEYHMPEKWVKKIGKHVRQLIVTFGEYLKAQAILILISFIIVLIGLFLFKIIGLNVKYPMLAAVLIGFVDALPILGSGTVMIPWSIICGINGDIKLAIAIIVLYVIIMVVRQIVEPKIVSKHIGIHPIFTLIAMYTGFKFIGILGMFIGPIVLIILKNIYGTIIEKGIVKSIFD